MTIQLDHYSVVNGLSNETSHCIVEDCRGLSRITRGSYGLVAVCISLAYIKWRRRLTETVGVDAKTR